MGEKMTKKVKCCCVTVECMHSKKYSKTYSVVYFLSEKFLKGNCLPEDHVKPN